MHLVFYAIHIHFWQYYTLYGEFSLPNSTLTPLEAILGERETVHLKHKVQELGRIYKTEQHVNHVWQNELEKCCETRSALLCCLMNNRNAGENKPQLLTSIPSLNDRDKLCVNMWVPYNFNLNQHNSTK